MIIEYDRFSLSKVVNKIMVLWIKRVGTDVSEQPDVSAFSTEAVKAAGTFIPD